MGAGKAANGGLPLLTVNYGKKSFFRPPSRDHAIELFGAPSRRTRARRETSNTTGRILTLPLGRDGPLGRPRPRPAGGPNVVSRNNARVRSVAWRSATGTAQRAIPACPRRKGSERRLCDWIKGVKWLLGRAGKAWGPVKPSQTQSNPVAPNCAHGAGAILSGMRRITGF